MSLEVRLGDRFAKVELVSKENNRIQIKVDDRLYELDMVRVGDGMLDVGIVNSHVSDRVAGRVILSGTSRTQQRRHGRCALT